jgi:hypothetical protein
MDTATIPTLKQSGGHESDLEGAEQNLAAIIAEPATSKVFRTVVHSGVPAFMPGLIMGWRRIICNTLNLPIAGSNLCGTCKAGGTHVNVRRPIIT